MCLACEAQIDTTKQDAFAERLLGILNNGITGLMISLGHRSGLFDVMTDGNWRSSTELATQAQLSERYVREWLGSMVVSGIVDRDIHSNTYHLPPEHASWLSRKYPKSNMAIFSQYISGLGVVEDQILECFKNGGGVSYDAYPRFHDIMMEDSGQSIVPIIVEEIVTLFPGLHQQLEQGIDVLDIGCGRGLAIMRLAEAYPNSRFVGRDLSKDAIDWADREHARRHLTNLTFEQKDLTEWREIGVYDFITALDAIHDQARPDKVLASVYAALKPGGKFLMQDIGLSTEPTKNLEHPLAPMLYGVSCMHCMTVSLAQGGMGLGAAWGIELAQTMLREAGFSRVRVHHFEHDIQNVYFLIEK